MAWIRVGNRESEVDRAVVDVLLVFLFGLLSRFLRVGMGKTVSVDKQLIALVSSIVDVSVDVWFSQPV